ncbi:hypothetical protein [Mesorhizobium sp.]|uniref:hypothetical protein n=1 Tax=Mesorhizobium sp. TaxID=1871066 RepID=UPI000FE6B952|nr:hypothetical protein [Mesorhizobium sp.]RWO80049.1 MAG: hypothetical protein EOQ96_27440 [Mesorhizobium sp.]
MAKPLRSSEADFRKYGAPAEKNSGSQRDCKYSAKTWNDAGRGNRVHFSWDVCDSGFHNFVFIYTPIEQPDSGLWNNDQADAAVGITIYGRFQGA